MKNCKRRIILMLGFLLVGSMMMAQQVRKVSGVVRDGAGLPLSGITIQLKGKNVTTTTDDRGAFSISAQESDVMVLTGVGFVSQEINVAGFKNSDITMTVSRNTLNEVVVTALGVTKQKKELG